MTGPAKGGAGVAGAKIRSLTRDSGLVRLSPSCTNPVSRDPASRRIPVELPDDGRETPTTRAATGGISGDTIGPYRLIRTLGVGGMGEVWLAEQTRPVHRLVALKVIKPGMDSRQVIARFEAERQALALMVHPAIAAVFDGGVTAEGRPYFVMEYVQGEPITTYC